MDAPGGDADTGQGPKVRARLSQGDDAGSTQLPNKVLLELCECPRESSGAWGGWGVKGGGGR